MPICNETDNTLRVLLGTELKIAVESGATDLSACDFTADVFTRPDRRMSFTRQDFQSIGDGRLMVVVDTTQLGVGGTVSVALTAQIPDADCPDGFRTEVGECPVMGVSCVAMPGSKPCVCLMEHCRGGHGGQWLQLSAFVVTEAGVAQPEYTQLTFEGAVLVLTEAQQPHIEQGVLSVAAEIENNTLTF